MWYYIIANIVLGIALGASSHLKGYVFLAITLVAILSFIWTTVTFGMFYGFLVIVEIIVGIIISSVLMFPHKFK